MRAAGWILVAVLGAACSKPAPEANLVARVNGQGITKAQFDAEVAGDLERQLRGRASAAPALEQRIKETVLRRMIDDAMVAQKAAALAVAVTGEEVEQALRRYKERFPDEGALAEYLERTRNSQDNMRAELRRTLLRDRVADKLGGPVQATEAEIAAYYERNRSRYVEKQRVRASRIVVRLAEKADAEERRQALARARELRAKASRRAVDFAQLARAESKAPGGPSAGELGWVTPGVMAGDFDRVVFALAPGSVSPVMETRLGFEIVKVWEKAAARERTLADVGDEVRQRVEEDKRERRRGEALGELRRSAIVEQLFLL